MGVFESDYEIEREKKEVIAERVKKTSLREI